jgi:hypothetical protein
MKVVQNKSSNGLVQHVTNSKTWAHINEKRLDFVVESRNLRVIISINGLNPFIEKLCQWFIRLVYVLIYNLLPWLIIKRFFCVSCIDHLGQRKCIYVQHKYLPPTAYG